MIAKNQQRFRSITLSISSALLLAVSVADAADLSSLECVISPYKVVDLASPVPGVIDNLYFEKSDFVQAGETAASLESGVEQASVVLAEARAAVDSEVQANSVNLDFDKRRTERIEALYEKKTVSIELKDEANRGQSLSRWRLQQAKDLKDIRQLELARAQEQLNQKTIRSPIAGYVLQRFKEVGEYVEDQPIMRIAQLDPLYIEAAVPLELRDQVSVGMPAEVFPENASADGHEAKVTAIDPVGDAASGTIGIRLTLPNPKNEVLAGVKCTLQFGPAASLDW